MNRILPFLAVLTIAAAAQIGIAQNHFVGKVVDVLDGKTFVLEAPTGRVTGVLQYIDVPEPEQPLYQIVCQHLKLLTFNREADFQVLSLAPGKFTGRLSIDGVDIGQQMLRDGAAWLLPDDKTGQPKIEYAFYHESETAAKSDKLGVWSIPDLKPAWLIRAENDEKLRLELASKPKPKARLDIVSQYQTISRPGRPSALNSNFSAFDKNVWLDVFAGTGIETPGLKNYTDPKGQFNVVYTSVAFVNLGGGNKTQRLECRVGYVDYLLVNGQHKSVYLIAFRALSDEYNFSRRLSRLTLTVDGRPVAMALDHGFKGNGSIGAVEEMFYRVPISLLRKITSAGKANLRIDQLSGAVGTDIQSLIGQLLAATE